MTDFQEIRKLFDVWDNSFGVSEAEILEYEQRLGKRLPETLRQYYLQLGRNEQINQSQDHLVLPQELEIWEEGFLVFYYENQAIWKVGIKVSDFGFENPPVYLSPDINADWEFKGDKLSDFLVFMAYYQALCGFPFNAIGTFKKDEKVNFIRNDWKEVRLNIFDWEINYFLDSFEAIVALTKDKDIYIATKTEEKFQHLDEKLRIEWDYNSLED